MPNELLWILLMLASFIGITIAYAYFGKAGLYVWMAVSVILANIQVMRTIELGGFVTALGNIIYGTTFLASDILNENHSEKSAKKAVYLGFFAIIIVTILMQLSLQFTPHESDFSNGALETIFGFLPRIAIASITAFLISQLHDVWAFNFWKKISKGKHLWIRNNFSTMTSQLLDNAIFTWIAFVGFFGLFGWEQVFSWNVIIQIFLTSYVLKFIVSVCDTPFVYLAKRLKRRVQANNE